MEEEVTIRFAIDCASEVLPIQYKLPANLFKTTSLKTIRGFLTQQFFDEIGCIGFLRHGVAVSGMMLPIFDFSKKKKKSFKRK